MPLSDKEVFQSELIAEMNVYLSKLDNTMANELYDTEFNITKEIFKNFLINISDIQKEKDKKIKELNKHLIDITTDYDVDVEKLTEKLL